MSIATIANRYARALADVVVERREVNEVVGELQAFARLMDGHGQLRNVFASPVVPLERKRGVLAALFERLRPRPTTSNFLQLLLATQRLHQLGEMLAGVARELDIRTGVVAAEVTTARALGEPEREAIAERLRALTGKEVRLQFGTDPSLIGGVVTRLGSIVYDGSIKSQLAQIRQRMAQA